MANDRHEDLKIEKLLRNPTITRRGDKAKNTPAITYHADPHIDRRKVKGTVFYCYRRGNDKPIYLGTADAILKAVMANKLAIGKTRGSYRG